MPARFSVDQWTMCFVKGNAFAQGSLVSPLRQYLPAGALWFAFGHFSAAFALGALAWHALAAVCEQATESVLLLLRARFQPNQSVLLKLGPVVIVIADLVVALVWTAWDERRRQLRLALLADARLGMQWYGRQERTAEETPRWLNVVLIKAWDEGGVSRMLNSVIREQIELQFKQVRDGEEIIDEVRAASRVQGHFAAQPFQSQHADASWVIYSSTSSILPSAPLRRPSNRSHSRTATCLARCG